MIQNALSNVYAESFFKVAHQVSRTASQVFTTQTNMKGLCGPNQLTSVKLEILIMTPTNSSVWMCDKTKLFSLVEIKTPPLSALSRTRIS
jgi:hypothetical protein